MDIEERLIKYVADREVARIRSDRPPVAAGMTEVATAALAEIKKLRGVIAKHDLCHDMRADALVLARNAEWEIVSVGPPSIIRCRNCDVRHEGGSLTDLRAGKFHRPRVGEAVQRVLAANGVVPNDRGDLDAVRLDGEAR